MRVGSPMLIPRRGTERKSPGAKMNTYARVCMCVCLCEREGGSASISIDRVRSNKTRNGASKQADGWRRRGGRGLCQSLIVDGFRKELCPQADVLFFLLRSGRSVNAPVRFSARRLCAGCTQESEGGGGGGGGGEELA